MNVSLSQFQKSFILMKNRTDKRVAETIDNASMMIPYKDNEIKNHQRKAANKKTIEIEVSLSEPTTICLRQ
jgi:hypothetical protein